MPKILLFADAHVHTHKNSLRRLQQCLDALKWAFQIAADREIELVSFHDLGIGRPKRLHVQFHA